MRPTRIPQTNSFTASQLTRRSLGPVTRKSEVWSNKVLVGSRALFVFNIEFVSFLLLRPSLSLITIPENRYLPLMQ